MTLTRDRPEILTPPGHPPACCIQQTITVPPQTCGRGRDVLRAAPRTDPGVQNYRTGLLPRVLAAKLTLGWGRTMRAGGSHFFSIRL